MIGVVSEQVAQLRFDRSSDVAENINLVEVTSKHLRKDINNEAE